MKAEKLPLPLTIDEEISRLIELLRETDQRIEELTGGEVDTVTDRQGNTFLLRRAQDFSRNHEADRQAAILNALPAHIALLDAQGIIISVNDAWRRSSGASGLFGGQFGVGIDYLSLCENAAAGGLALAAGIRGVLAGDSKNFSLEYACRPPAEPLWMLLSVTPLAAVRRSGAVVMHLDISARKLAEVARNTLEGQIRETQKMEAIGTLAGGIAHDFNNIIAAILGNAELARQDVPDNVHALESIAEIRKASIRGRNLVEQILSFSRRQPTDRRPIELGPVVAEAVRLLRATLPVGLELKAACAAGLPRVLADATQIQQVVINLAINAIQAIDGHGGRIEIRLGPALIDAARAEAIPGLRALYAKSPGPAVLLEVSDDGPGMAAEILARIFEPFFTTKAVDQGTGLGLAVVQGIIQTHEGAIIVVSQPGRGTRFSLYFPAASAALVSSPETANAQASPPGLKGAFGGQHVLYLDDDESVVFMVTRLLKRRGFQVSGFTDQAAALATLKADPGSFDLVVTDYNMPGQSGLDVARAVREIRAELPVAVASGFIDEALQSQAAGAGIRELIFKGAIEDFCDSVQRLLELPVDTAASPPSPAPIGAGQSCSQRPLL